MLAILKKEFKNAFHSVVGWLFIAVLFCVINLYFFNYNMVYGVPSMNYTMYGSVILMIMLIPVLTMRTLSEEQRQKTDQLLLTAPISVWKIVLGKYLALASIYAIPVAITCFYPLYLSRFGEVTMGESYVSILGFFLFGLAYIALGMFVSSLTENIVIAAVLGVLFSFLGYMIAAISNALGISDGILGKIIGFLDTSTPFANLVSGYIDVCSIVYYVMFTFVFLALTTLKIQGRRVGKDDKGLFVKLTIARILVIAVGAGAVFGVSKVPTTYTQIDTTSKKLYSITDTSVQFAKAMEKDVTIYVLVAEQDKDAQIDSVLKRYSNATKHIHIEYIDPVSQTNFYKTYTDSEPTSNSLILVCGDVSKVIDYNDLYESSLDYSTYSYTKTGIDAEGQITSGLSYVINDERPIVYNVVGQEEASLGDNFTKAAEKGNVTIEELPITTADIVPVDAQAVIINAPGKDFNEQDADKIIAYLKTGGNAVIVTNISAQDTPNLDRILAEYKLSVMDGMALEFSRTNLLNAQYYNYMLPDLSYDVAISDFWSKNGTYIFAPLSQAIAVPEDEVENMDYNVFMKTSEKSLNKADLNSTNYTEVEEGDTEGPLDIGLCATKTLEEEKTSKRYLFTSIDIFADQADQTVAGSNSKMFAGIMRSLTNSEDAIYIPAKSFDNANLSINSLESILVFIIGVVFIPLTTLILGIIVWSRRRKK